MKCRFESADIKSLWAYFYLFFVIMLSYVNVEYNIFVFFIFLLFALPFIRKPEYYLGITVLLNTISYYFVGASEGVFSINTILFLIYMLNMLVIKKGHIKVDSRCVFSLVCLAVLTVISYEHSEFHYINGMYRLIYLILVFMILGSTIRIDIDLFCEILPNLSVVMVIGYYVSVLLSKTFVDGRLTIANDVNTNTFGMSCAQISTILCVSFFVSKKKSIFKLIFSFLIVLLAFLSGSRGAILAFVTSVCIVLLIRAKRNKKISGYLFIFATIGTIIFGLIAMAGPMIGLDNSRFNISDAFSNDGSGTTRLLIISTMFPLIIQNKYYIWGYGPGHECSRILIKKNIIFNFSHTHNTFFESFGELGVGGLLFTVVCTIYSIRNIFKYSKHSESSYIVFAMFTCLLINGMAESYFCDAIFWVLLMITRNLYYGQNQNTKMNEEIM